MIFAAVGGSVALALTETLASCPFQVALRRRHEHHSSGVGEKEGREVEIHASKCAVILALVNRVGGIPPRTADKFGPQCELKGTV
jgi:hypothetical protein